LDICDVNLLNGKSTLCEIFGWEWEYLSLLKNDFVTIISGLTRDERKNGRDFSGLISGYPGVFLMAFAWSFPECFCKYPMVL
jgi:hypothetical protein